MFITIKFGGTSVGDAGRIRKAAELVAHEVAAGHKVVVVTSAMTGVTNKLVGLVAARPGPPVDEQTRVMQFFHFTKELEQKHIQTARECIRDPKLIEETANTLYSERHALELVAERGVVGLGDTVEADDGKVHEKPGEDFPAEGKICVHSGGASGSTSM